MNAILKHFLLAISLLIATAVSLAADPGSPKVVQGVAIYLGVVPAEVILGHPKGHPEMQMHGGVPHGSNRYHVVVALFDDATGKRVTGAKVKAMVAQAGMSGERKTLETMRISGSESYGNWFTLPEQGAYLIQIQIDGLKGRGKIEADLEYMRP
jgi:hypothetical protein